jgi:hypothetical protein
MASQAFRLAAWDLRLPYLACFGDGNARGSTQSGKASSLARRHGV